MAGILDNKQRVMDTIITEEGRRQIAQGDLRINFISFTDRHTFYEGDTSNVAREAGDRLFFEAANRPQDQIIFETDFDGKLLSYRGADIEIQSGKILSASADTYLSYLASGEAATVTEKLLSGSSSNFFNQYIISTKEKFSYTTGFNISPSSVTFKITDTSPFKEDDITEASTDRIEGLFEDMRFTHVPNFQFLPPENKPRVGSDTGAPLGNYQDTRQRLLSTAKDLENHLKDRDFLEVNFVETSTHNNLVAQIVEAKADGIEKLSIIDFGEFPDEDPFSPGKRVFFVGKLYSDGFGILTYVNLFTIVFD
jgi:hypothetical protein